MIITLYKNKNTIQPVGETTFAELFRKLLSSRQEEAEDLRSLAGTDPVKYKERKGDLPAFSIGRFSRREIGGLCENGYEPFICLEIDHVETDMEGLIEMLKKWEYSFCVFPSISGQGVRVLVKTDSTLETRDQYFDSAAEALSEYTGIPLKTKDTKDTTHVDTGTRDVSRLWFYSGVKKEEFYYHPGSKVFRKTVSGRPLPPASAPKPGTTGRQGRHFSKYKYEFSDFEKAEAYVREIEKMQIDVTSTYEDWWKCGRALAGEFGEDGRDLFHRISQFHSEYDVRKCDLKYDNCVRDPGSRIDLGSFYHVCRSYSVTPDFSAEYKAVAPQITDKDLEDLDREISDTRIKAFDPGMEQVVISYLAAKGSRYDEMMLEVPGLRAECFKSEGAERIFQIISERSGSGQWIDFKTIESILWSSGEAEVIAPFKNAALNLPKKEVVIGYAKRVYHLYRRMELANIYKEAAERAVMFEDDLDGMVRDVDVSVAGNMEISSRSGDGSISGQMAEFRKKREDLWRKLVDDPDTLLGVPCGIFAEDMFCSGRQAPHLVIAAARPGMGKTAKLINEILAAAKGGYPVGVASLEMGTNELIKRMVVTESKVSNEKMRRPEKMDASKDIGRIEAAEDRIGALPIFIKDNVFSLVALKAQARIWKRTKGIKALYIDYLQLIEHNTKGSRNDDVSAITRSLKLLAKELDIPVILLSQLSRSVETRGGSKRPILSDLRESGAIEQDADIVIFLYRPEYYGIMEDESGLSLKGICELIYAKHRDGPLGVVKARYIGELFTFEDLDDLDDFAPSGQIAVKIENDDDDVPEVNFSTDNLNYTPERRNDDDDIPF